MAGILPRYSLRALWIVISAVAVGAAVIHYVANERHRRQIEFSRDQLAYHMSVDVGLLESLEKQVGHLSRANSISDSGETLSSWRLRASLLTGYESLDSERGDIAFPWNDQRNAAWGQDVARLYCVEFPGERRGSRTETNVVAITGPDTLFEEGNSGRISDVDRDLIVLVEISSVRGFHWMQAGDLDVRYAQTREPSPEGLSIGGNFSDGFHVAFADGEVWFLSNAISIDSLAPFFRISGAKTYDREEVLKPFLIYRNSALDKYRPN